ncbi:MAG: FtsX-like permease family protein [Bacteroidota bacterium]
MGLEDPIGQTVKLWGEERRIIGVVKDFNFESLYDDVMPCFLQAYPDLTSVLIKINANNTAETITRIEDFHKDFNGGLPFDFTFMDDDYQQLYVAEQRVATLSRYFACIAIVISSLGLLALAAFTTERRQKEIGIRKVLGSSSFNIVRLLSSDFMKMVMIAIIISVPISYFLAEEWLSAFAFRVDLSWWWFALSGTIALLIAMITVSLQTLRAANLNPVVCLKEE